MPCFNARCGRGEASAYSGGVSYSDLVNSISNEAVN